MTESNYYELTLSGVAYDDTFQGGPRFATDWQGSDGRMWRVSSLDNDRTTETMIFAMENGEPNYFDLDAVKRFIGSRTEQGGFLQEYLQRELDYNRKVADGEGELDPEMPTMVLRNRFCDLYGALAIDELDEDELRLL